MMNNSTRTYLREIQNKLRSSITGEKESTNENAVIDYAVKALYDLFKNQKLLRLPQVKATTGLSKSSIYARIAEGTFPKQIPLGGSRYTKLDK